MASTRRSAGTPRLAWEFLAHSEVGLVRKNNQDSGYVSTTMLLVADGMGGAAAGDLASAVAVDTIAQVDDRGSSTRAGSVEPGSESVRLEALAGGISAANNRLAELIKTDYTLEGMGTTVTAAVLEDDGIGLAHLGDSRAYLVTDEGMQQLTHDHSWVQSLIDEGKISEEEAAAHPHRSLLLKVLNGQPANEPDLRSIPAKPGDRLLLCSDGLCGFVEDSDIEAAVSGTTLTEAMNRLVAAAHAAGGLDNITIIIADLYDPDATAIRPGVAGEGEHPTEATAELDLGISESRVAGPTAEPHRLGAAADQDVSAAELMIKERAALRAAAQSGDYDELDSDDGDTYGEDLDDDEIEDEDRYAPQPPSKRRWHRPLLLSLVVLLIIAAGTAAGYAWTRTQYYVGAAEENVAIFQGLNDSVPGLPLSRVYEVQDLRVSELPGYYQQLVRGTIDTGTLDSARATVNQLRETADRCAAQRSASPTPAPSTKPSTTPKGSPKSSPKSSPSTSPTSKPKPPKGSPTNAGSAAPSPSVSSSTPGDLPGDEKC